MPGLRFAGHACTLLLIATLSATTAGQVAPTDTELAAYEGLFAAVAAGDPQRLRQRLGQTDDVDPRDGHGRTPLHVATHLGAHDAMRALVAAGADPNALDYQRYDIVTIAAVADDLPTLQLALELGGRAGNVTSPYDGTALIAAAHLGHADVVATLVAAGAPLDHVNNLGWTALIESIVLGDGGPRHLRTLEILLAAGADPNLADGQGSTPLTLAGNRGYRTMAERLTAAGGR